MVFSLSSCKKVGGWCCVHVGGASQTENNMNSFQLPISHYILSCLVGVPTKILLTDLVDHSSLLLNSWNVSCYGDNWLNIRGSFSFVFVLMSRQNWLNVRIRIVLDKLDLIALSMQKTIYPQIVLTSPLYWLSVYVSHLCPLLSVSVLMPVQPASRLQFQSGLSYKY